MNEARIKQIKADLCSTLFNAKHGIGYENQIVNLIDDLIEAKVEQVLHERDCRAVD